VLSPEIRRRLLDLPVPEAEKKELIAECLYLSREQQLVYVEELERVNQETPGLLIGRVKSLPLPPEQIRRLLEQLEYVPLEKQYEFVTFLEQSVAAQGGNP
jgi:hypothetical protein